MPTRPRPPVRDPKLETLRAEGTLNRHADEVTDPVFASREFFDPRDPVKAKSKMSRRVEIEARAVAATAAAFHFSRPSFIRRSARFSSGAWPGCCRRSAGRALATS